MGAELFAMLPLNVLIPLPVPLSVSALARGAADQQIRVDRKWLRTIVTDCLNGLNRRQFELPAV